MTKVRLPNGQVVAAKIGDISAKGYRTASVRVSNGGQQVSVSGRVTTRHGFDRTLPFEVNMNGLNALAAFQGADEVYAS